jgi:hypothetical protein
MDVSREPWLFHRYDQGKEERRDGIHVHGKGHGDQDNGRDIGQKDPARSDRERRQIHVVATVGKNAVPLEHGHNAGDGHGERQKEVLVGKRRGVGVKGSFLAQKAQQAGILVHQQDGDERARSRQQSEHGAYTESQAAFAIAGKHAQAKVRH